MQRPHWNHYFSIKLIHTTFVLWGYKECIHPKHEGYLNSELKSFAIRLEHQGCKPFICKFPFKLPEPEKGMTPVIVREVKSWAWKFFSEVGTVSDAWQLCDSKNACLEKAMATFKQDGLIPDKLYRQGYIDIKEIKFPKSWDGFQEQCRAAVEQWASGKGWPIGWKKT